VIWRTSKRDIELDHVLVMGIINATPDSFSDGGVAFTFDDALRHADKLISEGADIIDIGGESTRPGSRRVSAEEEISRVVPAIAEIAKRFDIPISIDTSKSEVARAAIQAGAEIVNDISGLRFDDRLADVAARNSTGLILMHSRGDFEAMHQLEPVEDIFAEVSADFHRSTALAEERGVRAENIVLDVGIGFGKSVDQNLQLVAGLQRLVDEFSAYPLLVGASRKSFLGKVLGERLVDKRLAASLAAAAIAVWNGARILRVHDVRETVDVVKVVEALMRSGSRTSVNNRDELW
jgi:dihydropteroate synthase